jgi:hypothetical protein
MSRTERCFHNIFHFARGVIFLDTPNHGIGPVGLAEGVVSPTGLITQTNSYSDDILRRHLKVVAGIQVRFHDVVKAHGAEEPPPIEITYFYEELPKLGVDLVRQEMPGSP